MKTVGTAYSLPKMHKLPNGARFIMESKKFVVKPLSRNITAGFKVLYKSVEKYRNKSKFLSKLSK